MIIKKVCCISAGFLGGTFSSVVAFKCSEIEVIVIDRDKERIDRWNSDKIPIFEPNLEEIVRKCRDRNLFFTTDITPLKDADIIFVCAEANASDQKGPEMKILEEATRLIISTVDSSKIIVEKSAAAIQGAEMMSNILKAYEEPYRSFTLISNPEFLLEGCAVSELLDPDRVLIGGDNTTRTANAIEALISIYEHWVPRSKIILSDMWSTELSNLAKTAFLAHIITGINSISEICEATNADISQVTEAIAMDPRIGVRDLEKFIGFRGVNFRKSIQNIIYLCKCLRLPELATYWQKLLDINDFQKHRFAGRIMEAFCCALTDRCFVVLGFALKKDTACTDDSAGAFISKVLLEEGAKLNICDPAVTAEVILKDLSDVLCDSPLVMKIPNLVKTFDDPYEAASGAQAIILCTDWPQFVNLDFCRMYNDMVKPAYIFDGNNVLRHKALQEIGFQVQTFGKNLQVTAPTENSC